MPSEQIPIPSEAKEENLEKLLSLKEQEIVEHVSAESKLKLKNWYTDNIEEDKENIVGIRSEDLIYFLECLQKGYIPVSMSPIRSRGDEESTKNTFFVTRNPEQKYVPHQGKSLNMYPTFAGTLENNIRTYSQIAKINLIYRDIIDPFIEKGDLATLAARFYGVEDEEHEDNFSSITDDYLGALADEVKNIDEKSFSLKNRKPALHALGQYLATNNVDLSKIIPILQSAGGRGGICITFNKNILEYPLLEKEHELNNSNSNELIIRVSDGKLDLNTIKKLKPLGSFEKKILKKLGIF